MLSGGGARGAYQVGVLQYLARQFPSAIPEVLTGVSAGGINAAFLAARQEPFVQKLDELAEMWSNLQIDEVFRVDGKDLLLRAARWGGRLLSVGKSPLTRAMVDEAAPRRAHARAKRIARWFNLRACATAGCARSLSARVTPPGTVAWVRPTGCAMPAWSGAAQADVHVARGS